MSSAPRRFYPDPKPLNRSERKVLDHIAMCCDSRRRLVQSVRHIGEATFLCHKSVQKAIDRLNELQLIRTLTGSPNRTSEHIFVDYGSGLTHRGDSHASDAPPSGRSARVRIKSVAAGGAR